MDLLHLIPQGFFNWCQMGAVGRWGATNMWAFAIIETVHIIALTVMLGSIFLVDMRMLGIGLRRQMVSELAGYLAPWTWTAMFVVACTGTLLFLSEANRVSHSGAFFWKMVFLALALTFHFTIRRKSISPGERDGAALGRLAAGLSLFCWLAVAFSGRAIAFLGKGV